MERKRPWSVPRSRGRGEQGASGCRDPISSGLNWRSLSLQDTKERKFNAARPRPSALLTTASQARRAPGLAAYVDMHGQPPDQDDFERVVALKNAKVRCLLRPSR
jgi:hypothetical protein